MQKILAGLTIVFVLLWTLSSVLDADDIKSLLCAGQSKKIILLLSNKNNLTSQEIAYLGHAYNDLAVKLAESYPEKSEKYFEKACELSPRTFAYQYNWAVKAYSEEKYRKTIELLQEVNPTGEYAKTRGPAVLLIALAYYNIHEYEIALRYFEVLDSSRFKKIGKYIDKCRMQTAPAPVSEADDSSSPATMAELFQQLVNPKVKKTKKPENPVEKEFLESSSEHFTIKSNFATQRSYAEYFQFFEQAYFEIGRTLGYYPEEKVSIYLYRSKEQFRKATSSPDWIGGFWDGHSIKIPESYLKTGTSRLKQLIFHEYVHALFSMKYRYSKGHLPLWLNEGCAEYFSVIHSDYMPYSHNYYNHLSILNVDKVVQSFIRKSGYYYRSRHMKLAYFLGYSAVELIVEKKGLNGLDQLIKAFAGKSQKPFSVLNYTEESFAAELTLHLKN